DLPISVPVHARIVPPVRIAPPTVILTRDPAARHFRERQVIVWTTDGAPLGDVVSIDGPEGVDVLDATFDNAPRTRKRLIVKGSDPLNLTPLSSLRLVFSDRDQPVTIDIF